MKNILATIALILVAIFLLFATIQYVHRYNSDKQGRLCVSYGGVPSYDSNDLYLTCTITKPQS